MNEALGLMPVADENMMGMSSGERVVLLEQEEQAPRLQICDQMARAIGAKDIATSLLPDFTALIRFG